MRETKKLKMRKVKVIKLGTMCKEIASELPGMLTHWTYDMEGRVSYIFQPKGLDLEGRPVKKMYLEAARLDVQETDFEEVEVPDQILGTQGTEKGSGFTGMVVSFIRHINGCFHIYIQPKGVNLKTGSIIEKLDFDLRSCEGEMITQLSEAELKESKLATPSPTEGTSNNEPVFSTLEY